MASLSWHFGQVDFIVTSPFSGTVSPIRVKILFVVSNGMVRLSVTYLVAERVSYPKEKFGAPVRKYRGLGVL